MDLETRFQLLKLYYKHGESVNSALRAYQSAHHLHKNVVSVTAVSNLVKKNRKNQIIA